MGNISDAAKAFSKLLDIEYQIILGKKKKTILLSIIFDKNHFSHLAGLQYLEDISDLFRSRRDIVFDKILNNSITYSQIESSSFYPQIKERIEYLYFLEEIFDSNKTVFKYNPQMEVFSTIQADFLLKNQIQSRNIFTFLANDKKSGKYFCRSFFPQTNKDYSENQTNWTLLYKKKIQKSSGEETVLFDKLKRL